MLIGNTSSFAIESSITTAYSRISFRALGFFVLHIGGRCYGVKEPDSTLLAASFDEVQNRIARRGMHSSGFAADPDPHRIASAVRIAIYSPGQEGNIFFGMPQAEFVSLVHAKHLLWAPDGDEAFDDGSYVLHFDFGDRVRLVGFKSIEGYEPDPATLRDIWLTGDQFYGVLREWRDRFEAAWTRAPKEPD